MKVLLCEVSTVSDHENVEAAFDWLRDRYTRFWAGTHVKVGETLRKRVVGIRHEGRCEMRLLPKATRAA